MKRITWLVLILIIVSVMLIVVNTGITTSYFTDDELSTDDALGIRWGLTTLNDGFENTGSPSWDDYWNENGFTTWIQDAKNSPHAGTYSAYSDEDNQGYLTTDEIEASTGVSITVSFWFYLAGVEPGHCLVQVYNGSGWSSPWITGADLLDYPTYSSKSWCQFSEVITDSQYLIAGFRLRFDTSPLVADNGEANIDDVLIAVNQ